jgi:hypothetical protein
MRERIETLEQLFGFMKSKGITPESIAERKGKQWLEESRTFYDIGMDEEEIVAELIYIEQEWNVDISDWAAQDIFDADLTPISKAGIRAEKLRSLLK